MLEEPWHIQKGVSHKEEVEEGICALKRNSNKNASFRLTTGNVLIKFQHLNLSQNDVQDLRRKKRGRKFSK